MAKRGRKSKEANKNYFGQEEEDAVISYINANTKEEKEKIFNDSLKYPFEKMVESIIRRYHLYLPDEISGDTFCDTYSFLLTKMDKFKPGKYKAYSYYGTICKNYLIGKIQKYTQFLERNPSYDTLPNEVFNNDKYLYDEEDTSSIAHDSITMLIKKIGDMVENPENYKLKDTEIKMGKALKNLLENWDYVLSTDGSNKLNKSAILLFLRDNTGFDTKGVRDNMKKFKNEFYNIKNIIIG